MDPIDLSALSGIIGTTDPSVIHPILQVWLENSAHHMDAISNSLKAGDRMRLRTAVHGTKGTALQIGATRMPEMCKQLENEIASAGWDVIADRVDEILKEDARTRNFVKVILSGSS